MHPHTDHRKRRGWLLVGGVGGMVVLIAAVLFQFYVEPVWRARRVMAELKAWGYAGRLNDPIPETWFSRSVKWICGRDVLAAETPGMLTFSRRDWGNAVTNGDIVPCDDRSLTDRDLSLIGSCRQLQALNIIDQPVTNEGLKRLAGLPLVVLVINDCPVGLGECHHRQVASQPKISLFDALGEIDRLQQLGLTRTNVSDADLLDLPATKVLKWLSLDKTCITDVGLIQLAKCANLNGLSLRETDLTDAGLKHLTHLPLQQLDLYGVRITGTGFAHISNARLVSLNLSNSLTNDAGLEQIGRFTRMMHLYLDDTLITDVGIAHLAGLRGLSRLMLHNCDITDECVPTICQFSNLTELDVSRTRLTANGIKGLSELPQLEKLTLNEELFKDKSLSDSLELFPALKHVEKR